MLLVEALCALCIEVGLLLSWGAVVVVLDAEARGAAPAAADWLSAGAGSGSSTGLLAAPATGAGVESCSVPISNCAAVAWLSSSCISAAGLCGSITDGLIASPTPPWWCVLLPLY